MKQLLKTSLIIGSRQFDIDLALDTKIDILNLSKYVAEQSSLIAWYGEIRAVAIKSRKQFEETFEKTCIDARKNVRASSQKRMTKEELNDEIMSDPLVISAKKDLDEAEYTEELTSVAFNAIKDRGYSLTNLVEIMKSEKYTKEYT